MDDATKAASGDLVTISLDLAAEVPKLPKVVDPLRSELIAYGCPRPFVDKVVVAVEELFVNVASYAYGDARGRVRLRYRFHGPDAKGSAGVVVTIEDEGVPFDPVSRPDPTLPASVEEMRIGGLGILMAKKSVDEMAYERRDGTNVVTLAKSWPVSRG